MPGQVSFRRQITTLLDIAQHEICQFIGEQVETEINTECVSGNAIPKWVLTPQPVIQIGTQVGGAIVVPGMAQHLRLTEHQSQIGTHILQAASIFHHPLPGYLQLVVECVVDALWLPLHFCPYWAVIYPCLIPGKGMSPAQGFDAPDRLHTGSKPEL